MSPHHRRNKKQPLIYHDCGKYGHTRPYCFKWLKINIKGNKEVHKGHKEVHAKKKWNHNTTSTGSIEHKGSLSKSWYFNSEGTRHTTIFKTSHYNREKGRIKGFERLVILGPEDVPLIRESYTNMNQLDDQRCNTNFKGK